MRPFLTAVFVCLQWFAHVGALLAREPWKPYEPAQEDVAGQLPGVAYEDEDEELTVDWSSDTAKADRVRQAQASLAYFTNQVVDILEKAWPNSTAYDPTKYPMPTTTQCDSNDLVMFDKQMSELIYKFHPPRSLQQVVYCLWDTFHTATGSPRDLHPDEFALCMHMVWKFTAKKDVFLDDEKGVYYRQHKLSMPCATCIAYASYKAMHSLTKDCKAKCRKPRFAFCPNQLPAGWCDGNFENKTNTLYWEAIYESRNPSHYFPANFPFDGYDMRRKFIWVHSPDFSGRDALVTKKSHQCSNECKECVNTITGIGPDISTCMGRSFNDMCDTNYPPFGE